MRYFYPRPPRGGRRGEPWNPRPSWSISIHALREEGDVSRPGSDMANFLFLSTPSARRATQHRAGMAIHLQISIHALREEGDWCSSWRCTMPTKFLSTPSARRATSSFWTSGTRPRNFYPRPPRGGRLPHDLGVCFMDCISIHALREEGDPPGLRGLTSTGHFYPRPPRGGRLGRTARGLAAVHISIHALREEGDWHCRPALRHQGHFYPRPPRGGRL